VEPAILINMLARRQVRIQAAGVREGTDPVLNFDTVADRIEAVDERNAGIRPHNRIANAERGCFTGPNASQQGGNRAGFRFEGQTVEVANGAKSLKKARWLRSSLSRNRKGVAYLQPRPIVGQIEKGCLIRAPFDVY